MKKYSSISALLLLSLVSCSDFLNIRPEGTSLSEGMDYSKSENIYKSVSAAYASLRSGLVHGFAYICAFEITSDNADKGSTPEDNPPARQFDDFTFDATNGLLNELWTGYYNVVSAANFAIGQMPLFKAETKNSETLAYIARCEGEARFIRAYAYFNLCRMFGGVPKIDRPMTAEELAAIGRSSAPEIYSFILEDLEYAAGVLPDSYPLSEAGKVTCYSAMALASKVCTYMADWNRAASYADAVIASGKHALMSSFREVFSLEGENCRESLFEIQSSTLGKTTGEAPYCEYAYYQGPRSNTPTNMQGWGFCVPSSGLISFYQSRGEEIRPTTTLLYRGSTTPEGDVISSTCDNEVYNGKVYTPSRYNKWSFNGYGFDHNIRILRYSDILLLYAESLLRGGEAHASGLSAADALNLVRVRAGLEPIGTPTLQDVLDERRAELAMEDDRFFDLVRTGNAASVLGPYGYVEGRNNLLPIPSNQLQLNLKLSQNPNY